jgi:hypothetical protein
MLARTAALVTIAAAGLASTACADSVFATHDPFGGFLGVNGFDVFPGQSVAGRFIPTADYTLTSVGIWFMTNDWDGTTPQVVTVSLHTDVNPGNEFNSIPSDTVLETWTTTLTVVGWNPELVTFDSTSHAPLAAGHKYWVVAQSDVPGGVDPVWCWASEGNEFTATTDGPGTAWESGSGAAIGMTIIGAPGTPPVCAADLGAQGGVAGHDGSLDNNDFVVFIDYFFNQNALADVGIQGGVAGHDNTWDNNDFVVYIDMFFAGCA